MEYTPLQGGLDILPFHKPFFDPEHPVFPEAPVCPSPFFLRDMQGWHWEAEVQVHTLWFLRQGCAELVLDGEHLEVSHGACVLFRPGQKVEGVQRGHQALTIFAAHFRRVNCTGVGPAALMTPIKELALFEELADHAVACRSLSDQLGRDQCEQAVISLFGLFLRNLASRKVTPVQARVEDMLEAVKKSPAFSWTVDEMSRQAGLSRSQLTRWVCRLTGISPNRFVIERRVAKAAQRLLMSDQSIQEISAELGYSDVYFFSKQFSQVAGIPPRQYRLGRAARKL